jgi:hypothetical protein
MLAKQTASDESTCTVSSTDCWLSEECLAGGDMTPKLPKRQWVANLNELKIKIDRSPSKPKRYSSESTLEAELTVAKELTKQLEQALNERWYSTPEGDLVCSSRRECELMGDKADRSPTMPARRTPVNSTPKLEKSLSSSDRWTANVPSIQHSPSSPERQVLCSATRDRSRSPSSLDSDISVASFASDTYSPSNKRSMVAARKVARLLQDIPSLSLDSESDLDLLGSVVNNDQTADLSDPDFFCELSKKIASPGQLKLEVGLEQKSKPDKTLSVSDHTPKKRSTESFPRRTRQQRNSISCSFAADFDLNDQFFLMLNHDPRGKKVLFDDNAIRDVIKEDPQVCQRRHGFQTIDNDATYPLSMLCALGAELETIKLCYEAFPGALEYNKDRIGTTLHYACTYQAPEAVVRFLLAKRPGLASTANRLGRYPIHVACMANPLDSTLRLILRKDFTDTHAKPDNNGMLPLHLACDSRADASVIELLVETNRHACNVQTDQGLIPLHLAILRQAPRTVLQALIDGYELSVATMDNQGRLPLHIAVTVPTLYECVKLLKDKFPRGVWARNKDGKRPIDLVNENLCQGRNDRQHRALLNLLED